MPRRSPLRPSDLRALAALTVDATVGVTDVTEGVHAAVWRTLGVRASTPGRTSGITGRVFGAVRALTRLVGRGLDALLAVVHPRESGTTPEREATLAALNGAVGDHLAASGSALATPMTLRFQGEARLPTATEATGRLLLLVHGLCMNDLQWRTQHDGRPVSHGETLAAHGWTPVYARYNSGLHISQNGRQLAAEVERLVASWPVPIEEVAVVAHSMGGLVTRSAVHLAREQGARWPALLSRVVFLGTPHHGAPLERLGNGVDTMLGATAYSAPFAAIGQIRSAGVTDLRHGSLLDADWEGRDRFERRPDTHAAVPLPEGVACYAVAASMGEARGPLAERVVGDGLVPMRSALGHHAEARRALLFADTLVVPGTHHFALLSHPDVIRQLVAWLGPDSGVSPRGTASAARGSGAERAEGR